MRHRGRPGAAPAAQVIPGRLARSQAPGWSEPGDAEQRPRKVIVRLARYGLKYKWRLTAAYLAMFLTIAAQVSIPGLLGTAIDEALESGVRSQLVILAGAIMAMGLVRGVTGYVQQYLSEGISQRAAFDLRNDFFRKLQSLSFGFFDKEQTGNLMSKATADVEAVRFFFSMGLINSVRITVMVVAIAALLIATNWRLGLASMAFVPLLVWHAIGMASKLRGTWMAVQMETGKMTTVLQENLAGMRVVKAFGAKEFEEAKFEKRAAALADHTYEASALFATRGSMMTFFFTLATGIILWVGGREVIEGRLSAGEMGAFILYMGLLTMPVRMAGWIVNIFSRAASAGARIFEVLDAESPVKDKPGAQALGRVQGHVKFEGVSLAYDSGPPAVRNVDIDVRPGQVVAILGAPGSGKSTLVHLIPRFYDVTAGSVKMDGVDIRDATVASVRKNVGIVLQDVFVFAASIRDNIKYGAEDASMEDVVRAASIAQLHDFIEGLPKGYDMWVGERGVTLSGGQRQRLAIARTILLDPPILILDDSTSSVDMSTEYQIQQALAEVVKGRTTFVIAHRLSTIRNADLILVVDEGEVVERGTHKELLGRDGFYRRIHDLQLRPQETDAVSEGLVPAAGGDT